MAEDLQQKCRDASYLELVLAIQNAKEIPELEKIIINEFVRREHECVTISFSDYLTLQKSKQLLDAVRHIVHERWIHDKVSDDECYMLALSEILNRYH